MVGDYDAALHLETFLCRVKEEAAVLMLFSYVFSEFQISRCKISRTCVLLDYICEDFYDMRSCNNISVPQTVW